MDKLRFDFKGWNRVDNSLRKMASDYRDKTDDTVKGWTKGQRAALKGHGYPPQRRAPQPFKTDKQRRWFFWALSEGIITVPYHRTGRLANSWRAFQQGWSHWVLENSAAYGSLVVGTKEQQAGYHRGWWWTADSIVAEDVVVLTKDLAAELTGLFDD